MKNENPVLHGTHVKVKSSILFLLIVYTSSVLE